MLTFASLPGIDVQSKGAIAEEVRSRRADRARIRAATNEFLLSERGIADFLTIADRAIPPKPDVLTLCLGRQIPTVCIEHLSLEFLAKWLNPAFPSIAEVIAFTGDTWVPRGHKNSVTTVPVMTGVNENRVVTRNLTVVLKDDRKCLTESKPLSHIPVRFAREEWGVEFDGMLPGFHAQLRTLAGSKSNCYDISELLSRCARNSSLPPSYVFREEKGMAVRRTMWEKDDRQYLRPPASWYYLPYLCLFLTGQRALVATVLEDDDDSIQQLFADAIDLIQKAVGIAPLFLWTPHKSERLTRSTGGPVDFTEVHPAVLKPGWRSQISLPADDCVFHQAADHISHQLLHIQ